MRRIAGILLLVFTLVQTGPVIRAIFTDSTSVFIADEEKGEDSTNKQDKKEKNDYSLFTGQLEAFTHHLSTAFMLAEKIHPSPCLEKLTPPPNQA